MTPGGARGTLGATVTGVGVVSAAGRGAQAHFDAFERGESFLSESPVDLGDQPAMVGAAGRVNLKGVLQRRRDRKLFSRSSELLLAASWDALEGFEGDREGLGLFFALRREPPDAGEADAAIVASHRDGSLDLAALAKEGRELYPPLLSLKTLPNMALAHVAIQLGVRGPTSAVAGGAPAGIHALREGVAAVAEGRCEAALVGAASSGVDGVGLRDWRRLGNRGPIGEAAVVLLIQREGSSGGLFTLRRSSPLDPPPRSFSRPHHGLVGDCGAVDALMPLFFRPDSVGGIAPNGAGVWIGLGW